MYAETDVDLDPTVKQFQIRIQPPKNHPDGSDMIKFTLIIFYPREVDIIEIMIRKFLENYDSKYPNPTRTPDPV